MHEIPQQEATKAAMELALYFRALDDEQELTRYWKRSQEPSVGTLYLKDGTTEPITPREMSNKIIHAERIEWRVLSAPPTIICTGRDKERWARDRFASSCQRAATLSRSQQERRLGVERCERC
jgi:hypothetical protein